MKRDAGPTHHPQAAIASSAPRAGLSRGANLQAWVRDATAQGAARVAAGLRAVAGRRSPGFGILMYHRVTDRLPGVAEPSWNVTPAQLRKQLAGLLAQGFEAWPLRKLIDAYEANQTIPDQAFAVTFDDGYENNLTEATPILAELGVPATIFMATAYIDSPRTFPFDDWSAAGSDAVPVTSWRPLTTAQCHELLDSGVIELGAHTHTHRCLVGDPAEFRRDLTQCVEVLADRFGITRPTFAFPYGALNAELIDAVRLTGCRCALTTRSHTVAPGISPFHWGRYHAYDSDTVATLAAKLEGWYSAVVAPMEAVKRPIKRLMGKREPFFKPQTDTAPEQAWADARVPVDAVGQ